MENAAYPPIVDPTLKAQAPARKLPELKMPDAMCFGIGMLFGASVVFALSGNWAGILINGVVSFLSFKVAQKQGWI